MYTVEQFGLFPSSASQALVASSILARSIFFRTSISTTTREFSSSEEKGFGNPGYANRSKNQEAIGIG
jgi:hypothetical protein